MQTEGGVVDDPGKHSQRHSSRSDENQMGADVVFPRNHLLKSPH